ncbi:MAG: PhzF family phenazine biosynthesis protein, partial [Bacteroidota bacterium]|nr:PhzF family phenazine biosynthesis protein [Bacteroidota bacterium]
MKVQFYTCDVFTDAPFGGNQLAVFPDAMNIPEKLLQSITKEFNFSETTFVYPPANPAHTNRVRIFTPGKELPFAGHPTVGTAVALATIGKIPMTGTETKIIFEEGVGAVPVTIRAANGKSSFAQLSAAKLPEYKNLVPSANDIAQCLSLSREEITDAQFPIQSVSVGVFFLFVPIKTRTALKRIRLNIQKLETLYKEFGVGEIFVFTTDAEQPDSKFRARMFAPTLG